MANKTSTKSTTRRASKPAPKMDDVMTTTATTIPHEMIAKRAFELFIERGCQHGHALEDWLRAERELTTS